MDMTFKAIRRASNGPRLYHACKRAPPAESREVRLPDPNQGITQFIYDADDDLVAVTDPRQLTTSYSYNGLGRW